MTQYLHRLARPLGVAFVTLLLVAGGAFAGNALLSSSGPDNGNGLPADLGAPQATETPEPSETPDVSETPEPTDSANPTESADPTETAEPTESAEPAEATEQDEAVESAGPGDEQGTQTAEPAGDNGGGAQATESPDALGGTSGGDGGSDGSTSGN